MERAWTATALRPRSDGGCHFEERRLMNYALGYLIFEIELELEESAMRRVLRWREVAYLAAAAEQGRSDTDIGKHNARALRGRCAFRLAEIMLSARSALHPAFSLHRRTTCDCFP